MPPRMGFWESLMDEMLRGDYVAPASIPSRYGTAVKTYNVGDVIVGEIVEEQGELTTGGKVASL